MRYALLLVAAGLASIGFCQQWRIEDGWSDSLPGAAPWSYGYRGSETGADLTLMTVYQVINIGPVQVPVWKNAVSGYTQVGYNRSDVPAVGGEGTIVPPRSMHMHPYGGLATVIRFVAPDDGEYSYGFRWSRQGWTGSVTYSVLRAAVREYNGRLTTPHVVAPWTVAPKAMATKGDRIDFAVSQDGSPDWDSTGLYAFVLRHREPVPIQVALTLEDYFGPMDRSATWELRIDGAVVDSGTTTLTPEGMLGVSTTLRGTYELVVKADHWLSKSVGTIVIDDSGATGLGATLANGDVDGDDAVTVFDYNALSDAFDSAVGDPAWNELADLDGDESVTVFDYNILSANFDRSGD